MLKTPRLVLRQWTEDDFLPFSIMCRDKAVMEFFPKLLTRQESDAMGEKIRSLISERGWGFWAVEMPGRHKFMGLHTPKDALPFAPCVEIAWRLAKPYWGKGYATEAAMASLNYAFTELSLDEVFAFTAVANNRSQAVMKKLGMTNTGNNFMHPEIEPSHSLCEHVLYKISYSQWSSYKNN